MYTTYTTDAIVLNKISSAEADADVVLYTRDFGLVHAKATGVRLEKSKLRYALQVLALVRVSLVRGKRSWRLTGAEVERRVKGVQQTAVAARVSILLQRFVRGAEHDETLFELILSIYDSDDDMAVRELALVSGILFCLGYLDLGSIDPNEPLYPYLLHAITRDKAGILKKVNAALLESHL
jgi:recombinational DNA repair protein (RecF pathway)